MRSHFNTIKLTDIGSAESSKAQENIVVEDDNNIDGAPDKVHSDECNASTSPAEKTSDETHPPNSDTSSPKGNVVRTGSQIRSISISMEDNQFW